MKDPSPTGPLFSKERFGGRKGGGVLVKAKIIRLTLALASLAAIVAVVGAERW
jgi:hypothetical protein